MKKSNERMEVKSIPFSRLLKLEIPSLAKDVIRIVEKHDPEVLQIKEVFDLLVAEEPQIAKLNALYGVHPLTLKLKPMRNELMLYVSLLNMEVKIASKKSSFEYQNAARALGLAVDAHLSSLRKSKNERIVHERIEEFLNAINASQDLSEAVDQIGISSLIDSINALQSSVKRVIGQRLDLISQRPKEKTKVISKRVFSAMKDVFKQIEVAQLKHTELDYKPLFNELNDTLDDLRRLVNVRESHNKRKGAERMKAEELANGVVIDTETDATETDATEIDVPETNTGEMQSKSANDDIAEHQTPSVNGRIQSVSNAENSELDGKSVNGLDKDFDGSLDQKKTAASTSTPLQLPQVSDDDKNASK